MNRVAVEVNRHASPYCGSITAALLLFALSPLSAWAQNTWINPGNDDWYLGTNWSTGMVPTAVDATLVNNGGQSLADRASANFTTDPQTASLDIGLRTSPALAAPDSTGVLNLDDVDLDSTGPVNVGVVNTIPGMFHAANGTLASLAGANAGGNVAADGDFSVGRVVAGPAGTSALGLADLSGALMGDNTGSLMIGQMDEAGTADGDATIGADVAGLNHVFVGRTGLNSTGDAFGDLVVGGSITAGTGGVTHEFDVGTQAGDGTSVGNAQVGGGIYDFNIVLIGSGSTEGLPGASGTGQLDVLSGGIITTDGSGFSVGGTNGAGDVFGTANVSGDVNGYRILDIGFVRLETASGNATGTLDITGALSGTSSGDFIIGRTAGSGTADGDATIGANVSGLNHVFVGRTGLNSTGDAFGDLVVGGSITAGTGGVTHEFDVGTQAGDGTSVGNAQVGGGIYDFNIVLIGSGSTEGLPGASGTGQLDVLSGGIITTDGSGFSVGGTNGAGDVFGTANVSGDVNGYRILDIGFVRLETASGNATGTLDITGALSGTSSGDFIIGRTAGSGEGTGDVSISGGFSGFAQAYIGFCEATATGSADGSLVVGGGPSSADDMLVGVADGACGAVGFLGLSHTLVTLQTLTLGPGAATSMAIDGPTRGTDYAAFDVQTAALDGPLDVVFASPAVGIFDLIISGSDTGITGDFSSVQFIGLGPDATVTAGIELVDFGAGPVEVYRVTVGDTRFEVSKDFDDENPMEVEVTISCNTGLPLQQTTMISEGNPVVFVVTDYVPGTLECEVTEVVPPGYSVTYTLDETVSVESCIFTDAVAGDLGCVIENTLDPVDVVVTKTWLDDNPQFQSPYVAEAGYACVNEQFEDAEGELFFNGNPDTESFSVFPHWDGTTTCTIIETPIEGNVESDDDDCEGLSVAPGSGVECTIVNSRLYAGIPTLGAYGLALLTMLMLGLGLLATRRLG